MSVYVHRHLLFGRQPQNGSESKLELLVREAENKTGPDRNAIKLSELALVALEKYSASLYGEPVWDQTLEKRIIEDSRDVDDFEIETRSLVEIHNCCCEINDSDGADQSVDAIHCLLKSRVSDFFSPIEIIVSEGRGNDAVERILIEHMVNDGSKAETF